MLTCFLFPSPIQRLAPAGLRQSKYDKGRVRRRKGECKKYSCVEITRSVLQAARDVARGRPPFCLFLLYLPFLFWMMAFIPCHQSTQYLLLPVLVVVWLAAQSTCAESALKNNSINNLNKQIIPTYVSRFHWYSPEQ